MGLGGAHGAGGGSDKGLRTGARILFNHNTSTYAGGATTGGVTSIPLGDYKGGYSVDSESGDVKSGYGGVGGISVTKVVDVEVDGGRDQTVRFCFMGAVDVVLMRCLCRALGCLRRGHEWIEHKTISTWVFFVLLVRIRQLGFRLGASLHFHFHCQKGIGISFSLVPQLLLSLPLPLPPPPSPLLPLPSPPLPPTYI